MPKKMPSQVKEMSAVELDQVAGARGQRGGDSPSIATAANARSTGTAIIPPRTIN